MRPDTSPVCRFLDVFLGVDFAPAWTFIWAGGELDCFLDLYIIPLDVSRGWVRALDFLGR